MQLPVKLKSKIEEGQALILVLLSMAVILTVVLSSSSRSVVDVSVSSSEEDALRAFSAAEAGVERALLSGSGLSGSPDPGDSSVSFDTLVLQETPGNYFTNPVPIKSGESATFWFVDRDNLGNFSCSSRNCLKSNKISELCWGNSPPYNNNSEKPAVLLSVFYDETERYLTGDYSNVKVAIKGFDPVGGRGNNFQIADGGNCTIDNEQFTFSKENIHFNDIDLGIPSACGEGCLILAKVKVFYNSTAKPEQVGMSFVGGGGESMPPQGNRIESTGVAGESSRKINVFQSFAEPPSIFDAAVFSLSDFAKN